MRRNEFGRNFRWLLLPVLVACGSETHSDERVGADEQKLDQYCRNATAVHTAFGFVGYASPQTYTQSKCGKGVVVDVFQYLHSAGGSGGAGGRGTGGRPLGGFGAISGDQEPGSTRVQWNDEVPSNQAECESLWIASYLFERQTDPGAWTMLAFRDSKGTWDGTCKKPWVEFPRSEMVPEGGFRFAASARTRPTTSAPTRGLAIVTKKE